VLLQGTTCADIIFERVMQKVDGRCNLGKCATGTREDLSCKWEWD
jgi:hypothetical protein